MISDMKKIFFVFVVLISTLFSAQTAEQNKILEDSQSFMVSLEKRDYDKILEMSHPMLLEKFDKEMLISAFKMIFEGNEEFGIDIKKPDNNMYEVSEVFETKDKSKYAFVTYPMSMNMVFHKQSFDADMKKTMISMMEVKGMKASFINDNTVNIKKLALTVALKDKSTGNQWRYVNHDEDSPMYTMVMPVEIIKKAKSFYSDLLLKEKENAN